MADKMYHLMKKKSQISCHVVYVYLGTLFKFFDIVHRLLHTILDSSISVKGLVTSQLCFNGLTIQEKTLKILDSGKTLFTKII